MHDSGCEHLAVTYVLRVQTVGIEIRYLVIHRRYTLGLTEVNFV